MLFCLGCYYIKFYCHVSSVLSFFCLFVFLLFCFNCHWGLKNIIDIKILRLYYINNRNKRKKQWRKIIFLNHFVWFWCHSHILCFSFVVFFFFSLSFFIGEGELKWKNRIAFVEKIVLILWFVDVFL